MKEEISKAGVEAVVDDLAGKIATIEPAATSAAPHVVGEVIYHDRDFYRVTANISIGDTLTEGTNIEHTSVGLVYIEGMVTFSNLDAAISYYEDYLKDSNGEYLAAPTGYDICSMMVYALHDSMLTMIIPQRVVISLGNRMVVQVHARGIGSSTVDCGVKLLLRRI